jgi:hypothetical protein
MSVSMVSVTTLETFPMNAIFPILIVLALMLALDLAAMRSGADSRDPFDSHRPR